MNALALLLNAKSLAAKLEDLDGLWKDAAAEDGALVTRAGTAWQSSALAGLLACLGHDPSIPCPALLTRAFQDTVIEQLDVTALEELWHELQDATSELDELTERYAIGHEAVDSLEQHVEHLAEQWVLMRDEVGRVLTTIAPRIERSSSARGTVGRFAGELADLDQRVVTEIELLFPAEPLCRGMQQALKGAGVRFDRRDQNRWWWWFEIPHQRDALETEPLVPSHDLRTQLQQPLSCTPAALKDLCARILQMPLATSTATSHYALAAGTDDSDSTAHRVLDGTTISLDDNTATVRLELSEDARSLVLVCIGDEDTPSVELSGRSVAIVDSNGHSLTEARFDGVQAILNLGPEGVAILTKGQLRLTD